MWLKSKIHQKDILATTLTVRTVIVTEMWFIQTDRCGYIHLAVDTDKNIYTMNSDMVPPACYIIFA